MEREKKNLILNYLNIRDGVENLYGNKKIS